MHVISPAIKLVAKRWFWCDLEVPAVLQACRTRCEDAAVRCAESTKGIDHAIRTPCSFLSTCK